MKNKGFTLIELLAVIVILAIIALIATPAVLNIIEDSRKGAAEASARNIVSAAKTYYMQSTMNNNTVNSIDLSTDTLKYDGDQATKGTITFTDGKASGKMYVGGYCVEISVDGKVSSEKAEEDECEITTTPSEPTQKLVFPVVDGQEVYFNPVSGLACSANQVETNVNNFKNGNPRIAGLKDGCMKWYAFLDSEDSSTVNLILDHNTTDFVTWSSTLSGTTPDTLNAKLQEDITNWNAAVKSTARIISASEVNQIAPADTSHTWNVNDYETFYYFHTGTITLYEGAAGSNTYAWLFDNTWNCTKYGCNESDGVDGYWTSSLVSAGASWYVDFDGRLNNPGISGAGFVGVRPVITVSKSIFE